jgi:glucose/arabinose dehydrogenase
MVQLHQLVVALAAFSSTTLAQSSCATINPAYAPTWGTGFSGRVVQNGLKGPRGIVFDDQNQLLIVESNGGGVRHVKLTDNGGTNVCVASSKTLITERGVSFLELLTVGSGAGRRCAC